MSSKDIALRVETLGKMYRLGREIPHASSIGGKIRQAAAAPFGWLASQMREPGKEEILWALKDVSFEIKRGEVVGFIGHNGAGKSTLLKILSRITEPTTGHAEIHGRIAALLEVGTGMHPELTGRENIYMNGTVLGMKKREIDRSFDEIIDFSGIEKFLDTPVKRYSSGMRVRLGFAIAAHLEPEILVVDEVLAVGDANFQKKCLGKMHDVASAGRAVLFVSHRMEAVRALCSRCVVLENGQLMEDADCNTAISSYYRMLRDTEIGTDTAADNPAMRRGSGEVRLASIKAVNAKGEESYEFRQDDEIFFEMEYVVNQPVSGVYAMMALKSGRTRDLLTSTKRHLISTQPMEKGASGSLRFRLPGSQLRPGEYPLYFGLADDEMRAFDVVDDVTSPLVIQATKSVAELGYDPSKPNGYFDLDSEMRTS